MVAPLKYMTTSHQKYVDVSYDPTLRRDKDIFIGANISDLAPGIVSRDSLLQLATDDPEHTKRRAIMSETLHALKWSMKRPELFIPKGYNPDGNETQVIGLTGVNVFKWLFDLDLNFKHAELLAEYNAITGPIALKLSTGHGSEDRIAEIYKVFQDLVRESTVGSKFMDACKKQGMDPEERLHELVCVLLFAGYGGTSTFVANTVRRIRADPEGMVPLYKNDKMAFLKESARINPPVGGVLYRTSKTEDVTLKGLLSGYRITSAPGDLAVMWVSNANRDPEVFGGPNKDQAYADAFDPARENLDKIVSWQNMFGDIKAGKAIRGCPGTLLAIQLCEKVVDYFIQPLEGPASSQEL